MSDAESEELSLLDEINRLAMRDPFVPFVIVSASGHQYEIGAGDVVSVGRGTVTIVRRRQGHHVLRQGHVTEVSVPGDLP